LRPVSFKLGLIVGVVEAGGCGDGGYCRPSVHLHHRKIKTGTGYAGGNKEAKIGDVENQDENIWNNPSSTTS